MLLCEVYGVISCPCGKGPIEITCTEVGEHTVHNFTMPEDLDEMIEDESYETKEELIERLKEVNDIDSQDLQGI